MSLASKCPLNFARGRDGTFPTKPKDMQWKRHQNGLYKPLFLPPLHLLITNFPCNIIHWQNIWTMSNVSFNAKPSHWGGSKLQENILHSTTHVTGMTPKACSQNCYCSKSMLLDLPLDLPLDLSLKLPLELPLEVALDLPLDLPSDLTCYFLFDCS